MIFSSIFSHEYINLFALKVFFCHIFLLICPIKYYFVHSYQFSSNYLLFYEEMFVRIKGIIQDRFYYGNWVSCMKHDNLYSGLVTSSSGRWSPILWFSFRVASSLFCWAGSRSPYSWLMVLLMTLSEYSLKRSFLLFCMMSTICNAALSLSSIEESTVTWQELLSTPDKEGSSHPCNNLIAERYFCSGVQSLNSLYREETGLGVEILVFFLGYWSPLSGLMGKVKYWYSTDSVATKGSVSVGSLFANKLDY